MNIINSLMESIETAKSFMNSPVLSAIWTIVVWIGSKVFDKWSDPYIPDIKSSFSYIKKWFAFAWLYIWPISFLIYLFAFANLDKLFVLNVLIYGSGFGWNLLLRLIRNNQKMTIELISIVSEMKSFRASDVEAYNRHETILIEQAERHHALAEWAQAFEKELERLEHVKKNKK